MKKKLGNDGGSPAALAIIPRLERIDRLVHVVEERHGHGNECSNCKTQSGDDIDLNVNDKTLSSAIEEVNYKGSLMDRLQMLENRVVQLQLWVEMMEDEGTCSSLFVTQSQSQTSQCNCNGQAKGSTKPISKLQASSTSGIGTTKCFNLKLRKYFQFPTGIMGCHH